jgi:ketosteroid isomerase-like protein
MGSTADNVATVRSMYGAFGRGDIPFILDHLTDDISWEDGSTDDYGVPWLTPGTGKEHVAKFFEAVAGFDFKRFDVLAVAGDGDRVLALIDEELLVRSTGRSIAGLNAHIWTFGPDGRVHAFRHLADTVQHVRAMQM